MRELIHHVSLRVVMPWVLWALVSAWGAGAAIHADGNVTVRVVGRGHLIVEGDGAANEILIRPVDNGVGDVVGLGSTLVNGGPSAAFSGVDGDFRIHLKGGDDGVSIDDGDGNEILGDLEIDLGSGNDQVLIRNFFVHHDLRIRTGSGDDTIELSQTVFVLDQTDIRTGAGNDRVLFVPAEVPDALLVFEDRFRVRTGPGRDFVDVIGALFRKEVDIDLGGGDDLGQLGGVVGGLCVCDAIFEDADVLGNVRFRGGDGQDGVVLESVCGIAPPGLLQDFLHEFESFPDDCSFLGGEACARGCQ